MEQKRESQAVAELPVVSVLSFYARHNANKHIFQNVKLILKQPSTVQPIKPSCSLLLKSRRRTGDLSTGAIVREIISRETHSCNYGAYSLLISKLSRCFVSTHRVKNLAESLGASVASMVWDWERVPGSWQRC